MSPPTTGDKDEPSIVLCRHHNTELRT